MQFKDASVIGIPLQTYILLQVEHFQFEDIIWEYLGGRLTSKCPMMLRIIPVWRKILHYYTMWADKNVANHFMMAKEELLFVDWWILINNENLSPFSCMGFMCKNHSILLGQAKWFGACGFLFFWSLEVFAEDTKLMRYLSDERMSQT